MNEGWVKLHRKINENEVMGDTNASHIFLWLLVNVDRTTGSTKIGRFWLSQVLHMNPSTLYKALIRLEKKYKVVTLRSNSQFTEISLTNWSKYQSGNSKSNSEVTAREQQGNTLQEVENKEYKNKETGSIAYLTNIPLGDATLFASKFNCTQSQVRDKGEALLNYCKAKNKKYSDYKAFLRNALERDYGVRVKNSYVAEPLPEITEAERQANLIKLAEMKASLVKRI